MILKMAVHIFALQWFIYDRRQFKEVSAHATCPIGVGSAMAELRGRNSVVGQNCSPDGQEAEKRMLECVCLHLLTLLLRFLAYRILDNVSRNIFKDPK